MFKVELHVNKICDFTIPAWVFSRDRCSELTCVNTIENLQLNNKRLLEQHNAIQAQVCINLQNQLMLY